MKEHFKDLYTRPTFVSIVGMISFFPLLLVTLYLLLFVDLGGGGSLGVVLLLIGLLFLILLITVDRVLLKVINRFWLSIYEAIIIISYLVDYYITHNNSFSIG